MSSLQPSGAAHCLRGTCSLLQLHGDTRLEGAFCIRCNFKALFVFKVACYQYSVKDLSPLIDLGSGTSSFV